MAPPRELPQRILQLERRCPAKLSAGALPKIIWLAMPWALAACFAIVCAVLSLEQAQIRKDSISLQEKTGSKQSARCAPAENCSVRKRLGSAEGEKCPLRTQDCDIEGTNRSIQRGEAVVVWDKEQKKGVLQLDKLPPPGPGKDYQLWVIDPKNAATRQRRDPVSSQ